MKFNVTKPLNNETKKVIAIGKFESLHLGHQEVLTQAADFAKINRQELVILYFPNQDGYLYSQSDRESLLKRYEPTHLIEFGPIPAVFKTSREEFMKWLKDSSIFTIFVGKDYKIKPKNTDDLEVLAENFNLHTIPTVRKGKTKISSTLIKTMLSNGEVSAIRKISGFNYFYKGIVVLGERRGKTLGFPTINIEVDKTLTLPKQGIYASYVSIDGKRHESVTSISTNPTFTDSDIVKFETHILNFDEDIYGKTAYIELVELIRDPKTFSSNEKLIKEINKDITKTKEILIK